MEKRIVISGYYGSKNAGDEAMLAAMLHMLRDKVQQLHITVISADPEDTKKRHGVDAVSWLDLAAITRELRQSDLLISGGGSLLQNVTSKKSLYYYLAIIYLGTLLGKRVMLYAQGIGPITGAFASQAMRRVLSRVSVITVRDEGSLAELARLGITRPEIHCTADAVLAIDREIVDDSGSRILREAGVTGERPVIGISVRNWQSENHFKEEMARAIDVLVRELGVDIVFLPMQYPEDLVAARSIAERLERPATLLTGSYSTQEFLSLVGQFDLMIAIRLHALIFASVMGICAVGISYDPKVDRFLRSVGDASIGSVHDLTAERLVDAVSAKWALRKEKPPIPGVLKERAARNTEIVSRLLS